ncbi:unnamed protein product [Discula destructiva]
MATQTRHRSRSSVDNLFELVENLQEDQLQDLLHELNSTPHDPNIDVSSGVAYFEEQRRRDAAARQRLRPTPSFLNAQSPEPADWPRQKPQPVSGSQWRQSMRIVSAPYARSMTAGPPISPPLTDSSPPASPPLRRNMTAPMAGKIDTTVSVGGWVVGAPGDMPSPVSPPRHHLLGSDKEEEEEEEEDDRPLRPSLTEFGTFTFGSDGATDERRTSDMDGGAYTSDEEGRESSSASSTSRHVSPTRLEGANKVDDDATLPSPPPPAVAAPSAAKQQRQSQQQHQQANFHRISTMPLLSSAAPHMRPRTATGHAAASAKDNPRAFRRVSRPQFLSPVVDNGGAPPADELARQLMSAFLFGTPVTGPTSTAPVSRRSQEEEEQQEGMGGLEAMLKEPTSPRSRHVFGRVEREVPAVSGIFEVLREG